MHVFERSSFVRTRWYTPVIPALRRQRQEVNKLRVSLDYKAKLSLKNKKQQKEGEEEK
jgi:hypothetical protein